MARVLVVDDDPWTQRMVSSVLSHAGHTVDVAADGWEAMIRAGRAHPELLIVEAKLPTTDGWKLVESLRSQPELFDVPTLFLTTFANDGVRGSGFRPDRDDTMAKPFRLEDLETRVRKLLAPPPSATRPPPQLASASGAHAPPALHGPGLSSGRPITPPLPLPALRPAVRLREDLIPPRRSALSGWLDVFGLSSVLMVLELERKSGVLVVTGASAVSPARVFLRDGRVVRAELDGPPARTGAAAVYELLTWTEGRFDFDPGEVEVPDEVQSSTSFLIMEGARLEDERRQQAAGASTLKARETPY